MSKTCNTQYAVMYKAVHSAFKIAQEWPWYLSYYTPYDLHKAKGADAAEDDDDWDDEDPSVAIFKDADTANKLAAYYNSKQKAQPYWEYAVFRTNFRRAVL